MQSECHPKVHAISGVYSKWQPALTHVAALASFDDQRFVAGNWAIPGQQPIAIKPAYRAYNRLQTGFNATCAAADYREQLASIRALAETEGASPHPAPPLYVFVIRPPSPKTLVSDADLVATGPDFEFYAVRKP
jgi:hypothetical protein